MIIPFLCSFSILCGACDRQKLSGNNGEPPKGAHEFTKKITLPKLSTKTISSLPQQAKARIWINAQYIAVGPNSKEGAQGGYVASIKSFEESDATKTSFKESLNKLPKSEHWSLAVDQNVQASVVLDVVRLMRKEGWVRPWIILHSEDAKEVSIAWSGEVDCVAQGKLQRSSRDDSCEMCDPLFADGDIHHPEQCMIPEFVWTESGIQISASAWSMRSVCAKDTWFPRSKEVDLAASSPWENRVLVSSDKVCPSVKASVQELGGGATFWKASVHGLATQWRAQIPECGTLQLRPGSTTPWGQVALFAAAALEDGYDAFRIVAAQEKQNAPDCTGAFVLSSK